MIQENELRHGNYYFFSGNSEGLFDYEKKVGRTILNTDHNFYVEFSHLSNEMLSTFSLEQIKPIPLTPEILEKCGFEQVRSYWKLVFDNEDSQWPSTLLVTSDSIQVCRSSINAAEPRVKYLHQLQNLFFALTGTELKYQP